MDKFGWKVNMKKLWKVVTTSQNYEVIILMKSYNYYNNIFFFTFGYHTKSIIIKEQETIYFV